MGCVLLLGLLQLAIVGVLLICNMWWIEGPGKGKNEDGGLTLLLDSEDAGWPIPSHLFGISFEELNHAGAGGLWAELVNNRGFEAGGPNTPSNIAPWTVIGNTSQILVTTERASCFKRNPIALRMEILCDSCPVNGVGVYNPGFWGMNIVGGELYKVVLWIRSENAINMSISFTSSDGMTTLGQAFLVLNSVKAQNWTRKELLLRPSLSDHYGRLSLTSTVKGSIWIDQISALPVNTYKGHGFRKDLALMLEDLHPEFIRFPGGSYVEGRLLMNAFSWKDSVGPWQERPGHFNDVWSYWTDDGLGFYEFLQLAEDLNALPVWVFNNGFSFDEEVSTLVIKPFVQDILHAIEFARGFPNSTWGSARAAMGHVEPFNLKYVAIGNQDCGRSSYRESYMKFYTAIKSIYPDINIISNCDGSARQLDHPADLYDIHVYSSASNLFRMSHQFDHTSRKGPKAFVSEYQAHGWDSGKGNLLEAIAEAAYLIGIEQNSDAVEMISFAPLFVNQNDWSFNPDCIVFDSWQQYGTPNYWMQHFFKDSSGSTLLPHAFNGQTVPNSLVASVLRKDSLEGNSSFIVVKAVNFGANVIPLKVSLQGLSTGLGSNSTIVVLTSDSPMDENSFTQKDKVVPKEDQLPEIGKQIDVILPPYSITKLNLQLLPTLVLS